MLGMDVRTTGVGMSLKFLQGLMSQTLLHKEKSALELLDGAVEGDGSFAQLNLLPSKDCLPFILVEWKRWEIQEVDLGQPGSARSLPQLCLQLSPS